MYCWGDSGRHWINRRSKLYLMDYSLIGCAFCWFDTDWTPSTYPILVFCLGFDEGTMQAFLEAFSLVRALPFPLCSRSRWVLNWAEELGKLSGLITRGMFFSPLCRALAIASDIILLAFSCFSCTVDSIWWCFLLGTLFSDEELEEDEDEEEDDEEEEEDEGLLFTVGLRTRTWQLEPLGFFRG